MQKCSPFFAVRSVSDHVGGFEPERERFVKKWPSGPFLETMFRRAVPKERPQRGEIPIFPPEKRIAEMQSVYCCRKRPGSCKGIRTRKGAFRQKMARRAVFRNDVPKTDEAGLISHRRIIMEVQQSHTSYKSKGSICINRKSTLLR